MVDAIEVKHTLSGRVIIPRFVVPSFKKWHAVHGLVRFISECSPLTVFKSVAVAHGP